MNQTVVVTGAATGMGLCMAHLLDNQGWQVFATHLPSQSAEPLLQGASDRLVPLPLDITNPKSVEEFSKAVEEAIGERGLNALIKNAGIADLASAPIAGIDLDQMRKLFEVNVFGTMAITQALLPSLHQAKNARIIIMTSGNVRVPIPISGAYMMSKCALDGMVRTLRVELAPFGIEPVGIEPGAVRTPMTAGSRQGMDDTWAKMHPEIRERYEHVLRPANESLLDQIDNANEPEDIAADIIAILNKPHTKPRYMVGREVKFLPIIQRLLPERTFENLMLGQLKLRRKAS